MEVLLIMEDKYFPTLPETRRLLDTYIAVVEAVNEGENIKAHIKTREEKWHKFFLEKTSIYNPSVFPKDELFPNWPVEIPYEIWVNFFFKEDIIKFFNKIGLECQIVNEIL